MFPHAGLMMPPICSTSGRVFCPFISNDWKIRCISKSQSQRSRCLVVRAAWGRGGSKQPVQVLVEAPQITNLPPPLPASTAWLLIGLQAFALAGCLVTGTLARRRRLEVEGLNARLRHINSELLKRGTVEELVCSADQDVQAELAYRAALEQALEAPAAAHPVEGYGLDNMSLAQSRRALSGLLRKGKDALRDNNAEDAVAAAREALTLSKELMDVRAERAVLRLLARGLRKANDLHGSLKALQDSLALSSQLSEASGDVDVLGAIGDVYTDLGDLEKAGQYYDRCILAIQEDPEALSSTWDC